MKIKAKKIPYYLLLTLLTLGASTIIGFLSFGGMYALYPLLLPAIATFFLSTAYEGEIYLQNIKGALSKLFKSNYLKQHFADKFLAEQLRNNSDATLFFQDFTHQLRLLQPFSHKHLDKAQRKRKKELEKTIKTMRKWFARQLFRDDPAITNYEKNIHQWLLENDRATWLAKKKERQIVFRLVQAFSLTTGVFMGLGTTYLLAEAFAVIPFLAVIPAVTLPFVIAPLAAIAGAAYGLLTYNAITDMINNDTLRKWARAIRLEAINIWKEKSLRSALKVTLAAMLFVLSLALTVCTAGTWWTVTKNAAPLFAWMEKMPTFVMGIMNPLITSLSSLVFNTENTCETLEFINNDSAEKSTASPKPLSLRLLQAMHKISKKVLGKENWWQVFNPFRLLLKITLMPLRVILFAGHLISIGVTADRMPGISEKLSAFLGIISEGFEDMHYFFWHDHQHSHEVASLDDMITDTLEARHGHDHSADLPTRILKGLFCPLFFLAAIWDWAASQHNEGNEGKKSRLSFIEAWRKQTGREKISKVHENLGESSRISTDWNSAFLCHLIERYKKKHLANAFFGKHIAQEKVENLTALQNRLNSNPKKLASILKIEAEKTVYAKQRFFFSRGPTNTQKLFAKLSSQVNQKSSCAA